ncbi:MAG: PIN domain-containing protein [Patescibacteria group bacterium]
MSGNIVLDTNVLIEYAHDRADWVEDLVHDQPGRVFIPTVVISEYWAGQEMDDTKNVLKMDTALTMFEIVDFTKPMAEMVGEWLRHKAYASGASIVDLMVAATVVQLKAKLATGNKKHFVGILHKNELFR